MTDYKKPNYFLVRTYYVRNPRTKEFSDVEVYDTYDGYSSISEVTSKYKKTLHDEGLFESYICKVLQPSKLSFSFWLENFRSSYFLKRSEK